VTKPFEPAEVEARVCTHLALRRQERELQDNLAKLTQLESLRDSLVHMIVHDMRSPVSSIKIAIDLAREKAQAEPEALGSLLETAASATNDLNEMATQLLDISRLEAGQMPIRKEPHNLQDSLRASVRSVTALARDLRIQLAVPASCLVDYDADVLDRVLVNLLTNAIKCTPREVRSE